MEMVIKKSEKAPSIHQYTKQCHDSNHFIKCTIFWKHYNSTLINNGNNDVDFDNICFYSAIKWHVCNM